MTADRIARRLATGISWPGLVVGTLFFALSLTPSLLPRSAPMQGFVSGFSLVAGYGVGALGHAVWRYLELPRWSDRGRRIIGVAAGAACVLTAAIFLWKASEWQNAIRALMGMPPTEGTQPFTIALIALAIFAIALLVARLFRLTYVAISRFLARYVPGRVSLLVGILAAAFLFWSVIDGVLFRSFLRTVDSSFQQVDALVEPDAHPPVDAARSGSHASLLDWEDLGRAGREFVAGGPTADELRMFFREEVRTPIRVYVGLNSAETVAERSRLALEELKRAGAFERSVLSTPTPPSASTMSSGTSSTARCGAARRFAARLGAPQPNGEGRVRRRGCRSFATAR